MKFWTNDSIAIMVAVLGAMVLYDLVIRNLVMKTDTYEVDEFQGGSYMKIAA